MKKRFAAIVCACALALAMPALAFANPSPSVADATDSTTATAEGGATLSVKAGAGLVEATMATSETASNVPSDAKVLASFAVYGNATDVTLFFNVGKDYANYNCKVYVSHNDGTTEVKDAVTADDGSFSIHVDKLSVFSIVMGDKAVGTTDSSAKSPQTGVDFNVVAGATAAAAAAAGVVFLALRKKVSE